MIVAYFGTHSDGTVQGLLTEPGQDSGTDLVDLYEADISVAAFATEGEARGWLVGQSEEVAE